tara:strand:+ start:43479 stop:43637 length:159 start_codon:yes stop_codon:yes gene_type:complete
VKNPEEGFPLCNWQLDRKKTMFYMEDFIEMLRCRLLSMTKNRICHSERSEAQ